MKTMKVALHIIIVGWMPIGFVQGQKPQEIHPWLTECDRFGCGAMGYYCDYGVSNKICTPCPSSATEEDCVNLGISLERIGDREQTLINNTVEDCLAWCAQRHEGEPCTAQNGCAKGKLFCDFEHGDNGWCRTCKSDSSECFDGDISSDLGKEDCVLCDMPCIPLHFSVTTVNGDNITSLALRGSPPENTSGRLVDCSNLIHDGESTCSGAKNSVCLVEENTRSAYWVEVVEKCANSGGLGVILYGDRTPETDNGAVWQGGLSFKDTEIPSVTISYNDGKHLKEKMLGSTAEISVYSVGSMCTERQFCSETIPCIGNDAGKYCDFKWGGGNGGKGWCRSCPEDEDGNPDPMSCFFTSDNHGVGGVIGQKVVESCSAVCASSLNFGNCKLCPEDVNGFDFGVESDSERCNFCPENDVEYPQKEFPLFGEGVQCWQIQKFFKSVDVNADAPNCRLAQMMNFVCGCKGPGYSGASTQTKRALLAWLPRIMALLSLLGSSFVVYDASKSRQKIFSQLMISLSVFDIIGSCSYAFTTLPIPEDDPIPVYGARGNDATCTAQGFFIQIGTISCFTNVSLSIYYLLVIKFGRSERELKKLCKWLLLCPVLVGLAFAFAGIPFYGNMILWCNNTDSWWPDIPVIIAILVATVAMATVCWDVYWKEKGSAKWRKGGVAGRSQGGHNRLSIKVFWQSFWYMVAFYLTWPLYLTLQYLWAADNYFSSYGLILCAGILVPMQGFWNFFVYIRPRHFKRMTEAMSDHAERFGTNLKSRFTDLTATTSTSNSTSIRSSYATSLNVAASSTAIPSSAKPLPVLHEHNPDNNTSEAN